MKIRILTYNIRGARGTDRRRDYLRIGQFLKGHQVDVALIQELDTRYETEIGSVARDLMTDHFQNFVPAPTVEHNERWYGNALLSKFPVSKKSILDISVKGREARNILEVFLETPVGPLHVVNTHKGLGPFERHSQIVKLNELLSRRSEIPLIVGGDINQWHTFSKALQKLNSVLFPLHCGPTFPTFCPIFELDRMWCRPEGLVVQAKVLRTKETRVYSDHYPLLADVELN